MILHGRVLTDGRELPRSRVVVEQERIVAVEVGGDAEGADLDAGDGWIAPGLIDLQVNGAGGVDLASEADPGAAVGRVAATLASHGVTAFCPTLISSPPERILACLPAFAAGGPSLGAHVEGPFISPAHRGVHDPACLRGPDPGEIAGWLAAGRPAIVTLAPELPGALDAVGQLAAAGVVVSLGHSGADAATAAAALAAGARMGTHLFNAMAPLHHRQPGLAGALLASDATVGLIADGVHVDRLVVALVVRAAGPARVALVSDAVAPAGAPPGRYPLGGQEVESDGLTVRRADGTIGGSAAMLDACLRNVRAWLPWLGPADVLEMATGTPARALGLAGKGRVAPGCDADLCLLTADWRVAATLRAGKVVYRAPDVVSRTRGRGDTGTLSERAAPVGRLAGAALNPQHHPLRGYPTLNPSASLDRLPTEQPNPRTVDLDRRDTLGTLGLISAEDRTVAAAVAAALPEVARAVDLAAERWRRGGRVVLFGAGTSGRLAALDAAELRPTFGVPPGRYLARMAGGAGAFQVAAEGAEDDLAAGEMAAADLTADDLALGIAASGRTPWVIGALRAARGRGAATVGLACVAGPALAAECDVTIAVETGPEALAGSTRMKAGTAQKLVLNAFSTALMTRLGKVYRNLMVDVQVTNAKLRRRAIRLVGELADVDGPTAGRALDAADREVKTAVVALRLGLEPAAARARLAAADGSLARALGETDGLRGEG